MFVANVKTMAQLRLSLLPTRKTKNNTYLIYLTITHKRSVRYITLDYEIDDLFQFDNGIIVCRKDAKMMNQRLAYELADYNEKLKAIADHQIYNCAQIKEILEGRKKEESLITIKEYMELRIERLNKEGRSSYAEMNKYTLDKLMAIIGDITLQSISPATIEKFTRGLSKLSNATIQMRLTQLKSAINEAIRDGFVKYDINPFAYTKMPKSQPRQLDITIEEFQRIANTTFKHKRLQLGQDFFLLSFYLGGINLADIAKIDFSGDTIKYVRKKTENHKEGEKVITIGVHPKARAIISKYIKRGGKIDFGYKFTYSNFQRYLNRCIKDVGVYLSIETNMCYYSARKSFSQYAFELGIKTEIIEYCIGQSMKENRPIYNYIRIMQRQADSAINKIVDYTVSPDKYKSDIYMTYDTAM